MRRSRGLELVKSLLIVSMIVYAAMVGFLYLMQRSMLFPGDATRIDARRAGIPGLEEASLATKDGEKLIAWVVKPQPGKPVVLFFHGNGGNLAIFGNRERVKGLAAAGSGVVALSYRGYGGSSGSPSEEGLHLDARAAYEEAVRRFGDRSIVAYGSSLGSGLAVRLATEVPLQAIVLEAPFSSAAAVAALRYPYVPVSLLMKDQFRSDEIIHRVTVPVLILHGERDTLIPIRQAEALFAAANQPRRFVRFPEGDHNDMLRHGLISQIGIFLDDVASGRVAGTETRTVRAAASAARD